MSTWVYDFHEGGKDKRDLLKEQLNKFKRQPFAASTAPVSANGSAKIECSHLIISSVTTVLFHNEVITPS